MIAKQVKLFVHMRACNWDSEFIKSVHVGGWVDLQVTG